MASLHVLCLSPPGLHWLSVLWLTAGTWHLCSLSVWALQSARLGALGVPRLGCFQSWMCDEGKLVVITEQMPLMRSLLDFQLASSTLHWDRNTKVTGWFCNVTSSPVVIAAIIILLKESLGVLAGHIFFSTYGNHGASFHSRLSSLKEGA